MKNKTLETGPSRKGRYLVTATYALGFWVLMGQVCLADETISVTYRFDEPRIAVESELATVTMAGLGSHGAPGAPILPYRTGRILLPYDNVYVSVDVVPGRKVSVPGTYRIESGQEPVSLSFEGPIREIPADEEIYSAAAAYPESPLGRTSILYKREAAVLVVLLSPVEYVPQSGSVSYFETLSVQVNVRRSDRDEANPHFRGHDQDRALLSGDIDNPGVLATYPIRASLDRPAGSSRLDPSTPCDHVIITSEALLNASGTFTFQDLVDSKAAKGLDATIVTTEFIYANYDGTRPDGGEDDATRIRNFIQDAYLTWRTRWVLLGGDGADVGGESGDEIKDGACAHGYCTVGFAQAPFLDVHTLYYEGTGASGEIPVNENGDYLINGLVAGTYRLHAAAEAYADSMPVEVSLPPDALDIDFRLGIPVVSVSTVEVTAWGPPGLMVKRSLKIENLGNIDLNYRIDILGAVSGLMINEVQTGDTDWVELYNGSPDSIDLDGWKLLWTDTQGDSQEHVLPAFQLDRHAYVVVSDGTGSDTPTTIYLGFNIPRRSGTGGSVEIRTPEGSAVDFLRWGGETHEPSEWT